MTAHAIPLMGRAAELIEFGSALARAKKGRGSIVLVSGEAGIGKTRLCDEVQRGHRQDGGIVLAGRTAPEESSVPYAALADTLRAARRNTPALWNAALDRAEVLSAIAPELAWAVGTRERPVGQPVLFEALLDAVDETAPGAAVLWVLDDIHWGDPSTWAFVRYAARRVGDLSLVLTVTYREEEFGPWNRRWQGLLRLKQEPMALHLPLSRLTPADGEQLVRAIAPALPSDVITEILKRAAGTPLLLAELASLRDPDARPGQSLPVSDILKATMDERKDHSTLTARELEVARLIASGLTNPVIARELFISRATVASHVARILAKLGFSSRSQIAAWVVRPN
jgi:DNA-binding CsgD family transcriptional regulator/predicted ATPase